MKNIVLLAKIAILRSLKDKNWNTVRVPRKYWKMLRSRKDLPEVYRKLLIGKFINNRTLHYIKRRFRT